MSSLKETCNISLNNSWSIFRSWPDQPQVGMEAWLECLMSVGFTDHKHPVKNVSCVTVLAFCQSYFRTPTFRFRLLTFIKSCTVTSDYSKLSLQSLNLQLLSDSLSLSLQCNFVDPFVVSFQFVFTLHLSISSLLENTNKQHWVYIFYPRCLDVNASNRITLDGTSF